MTRKLWLSLIAAFACGGFIYLSHLSAQNAELYIGSQRCAKCHPYQYQVWQNGPHARTTEELSARRKADKRCTQCHMTLQPDPESIRPEGIQNITCERCHGPGKHYAYPYVMKDSELRHLVGLRKEPAQLCTLCHTSGAPSIRPFSYKERWQLIDHKTPKK